MSQHMRGGCKMHQTVTETAKRLMDQLAKTGAYRPADLCLVLGNPRDAVQPPTGDSFSFCAPMRKQDAMIVTTQVHLRERGGPDQR